MRRPHPGGSGALLIGPVGTDPRAAEGPSCGHACRKGRHGWAQRHPAPPGCATPRPGTDAGHLPVCSAAAVRRSGAGLRPRGPAAGMRAARGGTGGRSGTPLRRAAQRPAPAPTPGTCRCAAPRGYPVPMPGSGRGVQLRACVPRGAARVGAAAPRSAGPRNALPRHRRRAPAGVQHRSGTPLRRRAPAEGAVLQSMTPGSGRGGSAVAVTPGTGRPAAPPQSCPMSHRGIFGARRAGVLPLSRISRAARCRCPA